MLYQFPGFSLDQEASFTWGDSGVGINVADALGTCMYLPTVKAAGYKYPGVLECSGAMGVGLAGAQHRPKGLGIPAL